MCFYTDCSATNVGPLRQNRRSFLKMASAGALTIAMPQMSYAAGDTILSSHGSGFCNFAFFLTHALQLGQQEGVKLDMVMTPNFADQVTILGAGQADAGLIPYTNFLALAGDGAPLKIVAGAESKVACSSRSPVLTVLRNSKARRSEPSSLILWRSFLTTG